MKTRALITPEYMVQNRVLHQTMKWGGSGWKHAEIIREFAKELGAKTMLDYGCGRGTLRVTLGELGVPLDIREYDPGIPKKAALPSQADLVVCTDVLEHVEPELVDNVFEHLCQLTKKGAYLAIATRLANKSLPDGRNAHLIVEPETWWTPHVRAQTGWQIIKIDDRRKGDGSGHEVRYWLTRK